MPHVTGQLREAMLDGLPGHGQFQVVGRSGIEMCPTSRAWLAQVRECPTCGDAIEIIIGLVAWSGPNRLRKLPLYGYGNSVVHQTTRKGGPPPPSA